MALGLPHYPHIIVYAETDGAPLDQEGYPVREPGEEKRGRFHLRNFSETGESLIISVTSVLLLICQPSKITDDSPFCR